MYEVVKNSSGKFVIYTLRNSMENTFVEIAPERGGMVTGFTVQGQEILYLNKNTFYNETVNVRGGIPILFPICGDLENGQYYDNGTQYALKNHGFARNLPWEVVSTNVTTGKAEISIKLTYTEETKKVYPFDFELLFSYILTDNKLTINQIYANKTDLPMPLYAGFHPYFNTSRKDITFSTDATNYFDYNDMQTKQFTGSIDMTHKKEAATLLNSRQQFINFNLVDISRKIALEYGGEFKYVTVWTEPGTNFMCVEPWMAKKGELNRGTEVYNIAAGGCLKTHFSIVAEEIYPSSINRSVKPR